MKYVKFILFYFVNGDCYYVNMENILEKRESEYEIVLKLKSGKVYNICKSNLLYYVSDIIKVDDDWTSSNTCDYYRAVPFK